MKLAAAGGGFERLHWIQLAQSWLELARIRTDPDTRECSPNCSHGQPNPSKATFIGAAP